MPQAIASTTAVRIAVASVPLTPSMPIFASTAVNAANIAESSAKKSHMLLPPPVSFPYSFCHFNA